MNRKIRVGFVIGQLHVGGYERQLYELASRLPGGGCEPIVYCLSQVVDPYGPKLEAAGVPVRVLPRRKSYEFGRILRLARRIREDRIDLVHSWALGTNFYACMALLLAGGRPLIASNWANDPTSGFFKDALDRFALARSRMLVVNSERGRDFNSRRYHVPKERILVVRNWLDTSRFESLGDPAACRASLGLPGDVPVAGFIGRLSWEKGIDLFLDVAHDVAARLAGSHFLVAGGGPLEEAMRDKARDLGIAERVHFTGFRQDVPGLLAALDLLVLTSSQEGLPNVIQEAMAAGRPVVATDVGGCGEMIEPGVTGYLADPGDRGALAGRVLQLLSSPDRGRAMGEAGRRRAYAQFGVDTLGPMFEELYRRLLSQAAGRAA